LKFAIQAQRTHQRREHHINNLFLKLYIKFQILRDSEEGQDMVEYALVIALIAFAAVAGIKGLAGGINLTFNNISNKLGTDIS
jgi:pilus assembly protein Flp/PilA